MYKTVLIMVMVFEGLL
uniref:Uncharacterized protein n=1 Tax=Anguilla anguilla TaxID=7936 RepID=A0A0E9SB12_ANGAN